MNSHKIFCMCLNSHHLENLKKLEIYVFFKLLFLNCDNSKKYDRYQFIAFSIGKKRANTTKICQLQYCQLISEAYKML